MLRAAVRSIRQFLRTPRAARAEAARDAHEGLGEDPGIEHVLQAGTDWLSAAQDCSSSGDGGVARHFSLLSGWGASYPETTGYIVPTMFACAERLRRPDLRDRGARMANWLVSIQRPDGGFQGGVIGASPVVSVTFNTGQILMGLASAVAELGDAYRPALQGAAEWLVETQDPDGCWRRHPTPFAGAGEKAYETHVAWGLLEAERVHPGHGYAEAALRNVQWALGRQRANGWFDDCCLNDPTQPLTHTIGYVLRGLMEAHRFARDEKMLTAAVRTADGALSAMTPDGWLPGRLDASWRGSVSWVCLTGNVQIAYSWLMLYDETGDRRYRDAAFAATRFVRRSVSTSGSVGVRGGVKGSFPVSGGYGTFEFLNWACKFLIDACLYEEAIREREA
jgi:hypothetical protein